MEPSNPFNHKRTVSYNGLEDIGRLSFKIEGQMEDITSPRFHMD